MIPITVQDDYNQLNLECRLNPKDAISFELKKWKYA